MKKVIFPLIALTMATACTPHGKWTPYSVFNRGVAMELQEASRQASMAKTTQQGLAFYETVYNNNRDDEMVAAAYGNALRIAGYPDRSVMVLEEFYEDSDASDDVVLEYIKAHVAMGKFDAAEDLVKKRMRYESREEQRKITQEYLAAVRQARIQKTIEPERPTFAELKGTPQIHNLLGVIYDAQGKSTDAETQFRKALDGWDGEKGVVENNLALCLAHQNKLDEAMKMASKAFVAAPDRPQVARNLEIITELYKAKPSAH